MEVRHYHWKDGKSLIVGERTLVMGVLNYTPDSFSDGGKWNNVDVALKHMEEMLNNLLHILKRNLMKTL